MACRLGDPPLEAMARRIAAENLSLHGSDLSSAVQFLECMLTQVEERGDLAEAGECCQNLAVASYWMASVRRSHDVSRHRIALLERSRESYQLRTAYTWRVLLFASQGAWMETARSGSTRGQVTAGNILYNASSKNVISRWSNSFGCKKRASVCPASDTSHNWRKGECEAS